MLPKFHNSSSIMDSFNQQEFVLSAKRILADVEKGADKYDLISEIDEVNYNMRMYMKNVFDIVDNKETMVNMDKIDFNLFKRIIEDKRNPVPETYINGWPVVDFLVRVYSRIYILIPRYLEIFESDIDLIKIDKYRFRQLISMSLGRKLFRPENSIQERLKLLDENMRVTFDTLRKFVFTQERLSGEKDYTLDLILQEYENAVVELKEVEVLLDKVSTLDKVTHNPFEEFGPPVGMF